MKILEDSIRQIAGFKLPHSHFLLGSKIHISDFYFAKRMFQNSFFAEKFAFLIARYIIAQNNKEIITQGNLTLIGYGLYSELLLSLVEKFLRKNDYYKNIKLSHNLISDRQDVKLIKGYEKPFSNAILIIPIACTFSTSLKIEEVINRQFPDTKILPPHLSIIIVTHNELNEELVEIERKFGWVSKDLQNRTIGVRAFYENNNVKNTDGKGNYIVRNQKYYLALPSKWHDIFNCEICFPDKPLEEIFLNVTDKTSVTPKLVYDFPMCRDIHIKDLDRKFIISPEMVEYRHIKRDENHYRYYLYLEEFIIQNQNKIDKWLNQIRNQLNFKDTEYVLIIAPGHFTNTKFVNLVNEVLFSNSANIIHYNPLKDNIQNFQLFYEKVVNKADKVYYVDDSLTTGSTFNLANYFISHTRKLLATKNPVGFDACIVLLDRSDVYTNKDILGKLTNGDESKKLFPFANLHLPSLNVNYYKCPLCLERDRFKLLVKNSFLDRLKYHFLSESNKYLGTDISAIDKNNNMEDLIFRFNDKNRYLKRIEAIHRIYLWFSKNADSFVSYLTFNDWLVDFIKTQNSPFTKSYLNFNEINSPLDEIDFSDDKFVILKVLNQPPFTGYQPIRKKIFDWVLQLLSAQITKIKDEIKNKKFKYNSFNDFKFLIRRASLLNANYIICTNTFNVLMRLYSNSGLGCLLEKENERIDKNINNTNSILGKLKKEAEPSLDSEVTEKSLQISIKQMIKEKEIIEENIRDFNVFYPAQIKELLFRNEARSIYLEKTIQHFKCHTKKLFSFQQLLRILQEENSIIIQIFWELIEQNKNWNKAVINGDYSNKEIIKYLDSEYIKSHYRYNTLLSYFDATNQPHPCINLPFLNYLWLVNFFSFEKKSTENLTNRFIDNDKKVPSLSIKTEYIIDKLKKIVNPESDVGAFFIVQYGSKPQYFPAFNKGLSSYNLQNKLLDENNSFLIDFLIGKKDNTEKSNLTIIEFYRDRGRWVDLFAANGDNEEKKLDKDLIADDYNRLLLIRINKFNLENGDTTDVPQALIGFYFKGTREITDINRIRYILLLRSAFSEFIQNHHENDEFKDWIDADKRQKIELLTGHGRDMLIKVALTYKDIFGDIIATILILQRLIIDIKEESVFHLSRNQILEIFKNQFNIQKDRITNQYFNKLKIMAEKIIEINEIENKEEYAAIDFDPPQNIDFPFSSQILNMICFELFVNAKKNRWIFLSNFDKKIMDKDGNQYNLNKIWIDVKVSKEKLTLEIANTCPWFEPDERITERLSDGEQIKDYENTAGTTLIKSILETFKIGNIKYNKKQLQGNFYKFIVTLELYNLEEWAKNDNTDRESALTV